MSTPIILHLRRKCQNFWQEVYNKNMNIILFIILVIIILFLIFFGISTLISLYGGVPFVDSGSDIFRQAFKMANLRQGKVLYELGSGIGTGIVIASREYKARVCGVEISPLYYLISKIRGSSDKNINVIYSDIMKVNLHSADVVYCYLIPKLMKALEQKFKHELKSGALVVSLAFQLPNTKPYKIEKIKNRTLYLYKF